MTFAEGRNLSLVIWYFQKKTNKKNKEKKYWLECRCEQMFIKLSMHIVSNRFNSLVPHFNDLGLH